MNDNDVVNFFDSSEWRKFQDSSKEIQENISSVLTDFVRTIEPYTELLHDIISTVSPALKMLAIASERLTAIDIIGNAEFVCWKSVPYKVIDAIIKCKDDKARLIKVLYDWMQDIQFKDTEEACAKLMENEYLICNPLLMQSVAAYKREEYDLAVLGFTAIIDKMLSTYSGNINTVNISNRVNDIRKKIQESGEMSLNKLELQEYVLVHTYINAMKFLGKFCDFSNDEPDLNRHWLMHGRRCRKVEHIDCIRVIHILYGTIRIGELGKKPVREQSAYIR